MYLFASINYWALLPSGQFAGSAVEGRRHGHVGSGKLISTELVNCALDAGDE